MKLIARKLFSLFWRVGISMIACSFILKKIDLQVILNIITGLDWFNFIIAVSIYFISYILVFLRWKMLLNAQGVHLPVLLVLSHFSGGVFLNLFLPSTIGGDLARTLGLSTHTKSRSSIAASVFLDRLSAFVGLVLVSLVSIIFGHRIIGEPAVYWMVFSMVGIAGCMLLIIFNNGVYSWFNRSVHKKGLIENIHKLHAEIYFFRTHFPVLGLNLLYSMAIHTGCALFSYFILCSLGAKINIIYTLVFGPVITLITVLPISIGGLGVRDMSSIFFYAKAGVSKDIAVAMSMLNFAMVIVFGFIGGITYVVMSCYLRKQLCQDSQLRPV